MAEGHGRGAVVCERDWLERRIGETKNRLADQLAERRPIDRGEVEDLILLLDALEALEALP
jgi:hypothetical protein